ncbi:unnamed protein product [Brachionus calyciflorus]|uniref:EF-hand domain-containing protein n=1 Tax=Brachionus calyciflorus TaxID=104777 RepID=A0A814IAT3_9BILA|nr:unnamed protein product [Brachionus calyciflorus]
MSYSSFRSIAGADNMIDFNEFLEMTRQTYPHLDQQTLYEIAQEKFALMDRNGDGRINYNEYTNAYNREKTPYGNFQSNYNPQYQQTPNQHRQYQPQRPSYNDFRNFAGADNMIDFNEFLEMTRQKYPFLDQQTLYEIAQEKFALMDRNGDGRINYNEFADAGLREMSNKQYYRPNGSMNQPNYRPPQPNPQNTYYPPPPNQQNYYPPPPHSSHNPPPFHQSGINNFFMKNPIDQPPPYGF